MAIEGLSDRASLDPRFKEIGRIRKGAAKTGNRPGRDLDYFRYVPDSRHQKSAEIFEQIYSTEPTSLEIHFPFDQMERVFGSWREAYGQNRLCKLRCDGARWHDWIEGDRHRHSTAGRECDLECRDTPNRCPDCPLTYVGRLSVILKPMWEAGQIGLITLITSSVNDIGHLAAKLVQWEPLTGKPFTLWRETERIGAPINGKRAGVDSNLLHLELAEDRFLLEFQAAERRSYEQITAPRPAPAPALVAGERRGPDEIIYGNPPDIDFDGELIEEYEQPTGDPLLNGDYHGTSMDAVAIEDLREDDEAERARQEHVELPQFLVPPEEDDWTAFYTRAVEELNYDNRHHASIIKDRFWLKNPHPSWNDLWVQMVEHQAEKGHLLMEHTPAVAHWTKDPKRLEEYFQWLSTHDMTAAWARQGLVGDDPLDAFEGSLERAKEILVAIPF